MRFMQELRKIYSDLEDGLILINCGTFDNVIRWIPPLVVTPDEIDQAVDIFAKALTSAVK